LTYYCINRRHNSAENYTVPSYTPRT